MFWLEWYLGANIRRDESVSSAVVHEQCLSWSLQREDRDGSSAQLNFLRGCLMTESLNGHLQHWQPWVIIAYCKHTHNAELHCNRSNTHAHTHALTARQPRQLLRTALLPPERPKWCLMDDPSAGPLVSGLQIGCDTDNPDGRDATAHHGWIQSASRRQHRIQDEGWGWRCKFPIIPQVMTVSWKGSESVCEPYMNAVIKIMLHQFDCKRVFCLRQTKRRKNIWHWILNLVMQSSIPPWKITNLT